MTNDSVRYGDDEVLVYIVGTDLTTGRHCRVDANGTPHPVSLDDNTDGGYTDYSIPLGALPDDMTLPYMSGRIYLALGGKLGIRIVEDGDGNPALQLPAGWVEDDDAFDVLHDPSGRIQQIYQTTGVPESFLLDRDGVIVKRVIGAHDWSAPVNRQLVERLLATQR